MKAFFDDLGALRSRVTVVTISEFGRRVAENGSQGFDHGWGNMMLVAGAGVKGGQYYGNWPGLAPSAQSDGDLKVTTDYRNVLGEIVSRRFPDRSVPTLFPGLLLRPRRVHGLRTRVSRSAPASGLAGLPSLMRRIVLVVAGAVGTAALTLPALPANSTSSRRNVGGAMPRRRRPARSPRSG